MRKITFKNCIRLIKVEAGKNGYGPAAYINHWDNRPFGSRGLTEIPFTVAQAKRLNKWLGRWIKTQTKRKKKNV